MRRWTRTGPRVARHRDHQTTRRRGARSILDGTSTAIPFGHIPSGPAPCYALALGLVANPVVTRLANTLVRRQEARIMRRTIGMGALALWASTWLATPAHAQFGWGYPGMFGNYGWSQWGANPASGYM